MNEKTNDAVEKVSMIKIENKEDLEEMRKMVDEILDKENPTTRDRNLFEVYAKSIAHYENKIESNGNEPRKQNDG
jgi:hypothetical protein